MRIRQVRPEFWTDPAMGHLADGARLLYIGLWNVCDDGGWMDWNVPQLGALLFPYRSAKRREADIGRWSDDLVKAGRLVLHRCGCANIPTLPKHQRVVGKQSFQARDKHRAHIAKQLSLIGSPVEEGRVEEGRVGLSIDNDAPKSRLLAAGVKPELVS